MPAMLPPTYQRWLSDWLPGEIPEESLATCDNCAMIAPPEAPSHVVTSPRYFSADTKCCTYFPSVPNFQVGNILRDAGDELSEGKRRVRARIRSQVGVDPLCVRGDNRYAELYRLGSAVAFGRAETLRCPYYQVEGGRCTIWLHREAVCSTWHCKYNKPARGLEFWTALRKALRELDVAVAVHCANEMGISSDALDALLPPDYAMKSANDLDARPDETRQKRLWGTWLGREETYYVECSKLTEQLDLTAIRKFAGTGLQHRLDAVATAYDALLSSVLPDRLRAAGTFRLSVAKPGWVEIEAGPFQFVELPAGVIELLSIFRGQQLEEARAALAARGFDVDATLLQQLYDCGFLVTATTEGPAPLAAEGVSDSHSPAAARRGASGIA